MASALHLLFGGLNAKRLIRSSQPSSVSCGAAVDETVIALTLLTPRTGRAALRVIALGLALGVAVACGTTSGLESYKIIRDLADKGKVAAQEADDMMYKNDRPEAAEIILRRHVNDVDDVIDKVTKDELINDSDKTKMLQLLQDYRREAVKIAQYPRAMINAEQELEWLGRR